MSKNLIKESFSNDINKGEITYKNHTLEFLTFFENHKKLCDEIAGLKYHTINDLDGGKRIIITKINYEYGIRKVNSFIIHYLHNIEERCKVDEVLNKFNKLENEFINDEEYSRYVIKHGDLTPTQEIDFNKRYINYLVKTFDIIFLMSKYLQKSLNIASKEIIKSIQFANYDGFFNNLSIYREEVSNDLSNLRYGNIFENFKKLIGYFYTYRYLMPSREQKHINDLLKLIYKYITQEETIKRIIKIKENSEITISTKEEIRNEFMELRNAFNMVYVLSNHSLSMKNILPRSRTDVLIDNTLI